MLFWPEPMMSKLFETLRVFTAYGHHGVQRRLTWMRPFGAVSSMYHPDRIFLRELQYPIAGPPPDHFINFG